MPVRLSPEHLHIWRTNLGPQEPPADNLERLLSTEERERAQRFRFRYHKDRYVYSHACLRLLISLYLPITPETIRFKYTHLGKPFIDPSQLQPLSAGKQLDFNLSHSSDLAVIALAWNSSIGIDTERTNRQINIHEIAPTVFTANEHEQLNEEAIASQHQYFFDLWSRKEAYAKALGMGLHLPFRELEVGRRPLVGGFRIYSFEPVPGYAAAVAFPPHLESIQHFEFHFSDFL